MKKYIISLALIAMTASAGLPAMASEYIGQVKMQDLTGPQDKIGPSILVTNPFYGTKSALSGFKGLFIFNPLSKVQFNLETMNAKGSETLKLIQIAPDNTSALAKALNEYQKSVLHLQPSLNRFLDSDGALSSWRPIADNLFLHLKFTDDLATAVPSNATQAVLLDIRDSLLINLVHTLARTNKTNQWVESMIAGVPVEADLGLGDLRTAESLRALSYKATQRGEEKAAQIFADGSARLLSQVSIRIWEEVSDGNNEIIYDLARVSGSSAARIESIDEIMSQQPSLYDSEELQDLIAKLLPQ